MYEDIIQGCDDIIRMLTSQRELSILDLDKLRSTATFMSANVCYLYEKKEAEMKGESAEKKEFSLPDDFLVHLQSLHNQGNG